MERRSPVGSQAGDRQTSRRVCLWQWRWAGLADCRWVLKVWRFDSMWEQASVGMRWGALRWRWIDTFDLTGGSHAERGVMWLCWQARKWAQAPLSKEILYSRATNAGARVHYWNQPNSSLIIINSRKYIPFNFNLPISKSFLWATVPQTRGHEMSLPWLFEESQLLCDTLNALPVVSALCCLTCTPGLIVTFHR